MEKAKEYMEYAVGQDASDLFIIAGKPISMRLNGNIVEIEDTKLIMAEASRLINEIYAMNNKTLKTTTVTIDDIFSFSLSGLARFRVAVYKQRGSLAAVIRIIKFGIPDYKEIGIPDNIMRVTETVNRGLVIVTGPSGCGKTTTVACLVDAINSNKKKHIIDIEDTIEFLHRNKEGIVSQREIDTDTVSYATALNTSLKQSPDVLVIGELTDAKTVQAALKVAENGHLVISTMYTMGLKNSVTTLIEMFPEDERARVRSQLSRLLKVVISEYLLTSTDGTKIPVFQSVKVDKVVKRMIKDDNYDTLEDTITTNSKSKRIGYMSMHGSINELLTSGRISEDEALYGDMTYEELLNEWVGGHINVSYSSKNWNGWST